MAFLLNLVIIKKMLFQQSLLRELRSTASGVFAVLLTTLVTIILIRALGRAASGRIEGELVLPLIIFNTVSFMGSIIILTAYIALLIVLTRWWKDSEMVVWMTAGKSLLSFLRPVWTFVWPLTATVAFLTFLATPWAEQQIISFEERMEGRGEIERISPGQFRESSAGDRVFFLENPDDESGRIGMVFVRSQESNNNQSFLVSATGRFEVDAEGSQWVVLERGHRTDLQAGSLESRQMGFDVYRIRVDPSAPMVRSRERAQAVPTWTLLQEPTPKGQGEMATRIGLPLLAIALAFFAIPLAFVHARSGRSVNLIIAILVYFIATNMLTSVQVSVAQGRMSFALGWWLVPVAVGLAASVLFWWRVGQRQGPLAWVVAKIARQRLLASQAQRKDSGS